MPERSPEPQDREPELTGPETNDSDREAQPLGDGVERDQLHPPEQAIARPDYQQCARCQEICQGIRVVRLAVRSIAETVVQTAKVNESLLATPGLNNSPEARSILEQNVYDAFFFHGMRTALEIIQESCERTAPVPKPRLSLRRALFGTEYLEALE